MAQASTQESEKAKPADAKRKEAISPVAKIVVSKQIFSDFAAI